MNPDLSLVIVNWNVRELLGDCLEAVYASAGGTLDGDGRLRLGDYTVEVWVVDNASADGSAEMVRARFSQVELIESGGNLGFTAGNNLALRRCKGRYVLLLNPDTRVAPDALAVLLHYMEAHPETGVVGPQLRYGDGTLQSSRRRFPTLAMALMESTLLEQWFPGNRWARAYHLDDRSPEMEQEVDWLTGACLLVRAEVLRSVGLLDERFFMYSEELDWCRRIAAAGWRIVYLPQAVVMHYEGRSSSQVAARRQFHFDSSKVLYFRLHHGRLPAELLRLFLLGTYMIQLVREAAKWLLGHKRALRSERVRAYAQLLRSGLRQSPFSSEAYHA